MPAAPQEDAALMAASQLIVPNDNKLSSSSATKNINNGTSNTSQHQQQYNSATESLARSNLLRLETSELLSESKLHIHPPTTTTTPNDTTAHYEARWSPNVRSYISNIKDIIGSLDEAILSPNVALLPPNKSEIVEKGMEHLSSEGREKKNMYRVPLLSDKFYKSTFAHTTTSANTKKSSKSGSNNPLTTWSFPFAGGQSLSIVPIGSFAHLGNAGLTNVHANGGDVLPVLDLAVLFPCGSNEKKEEGGEESSGFMGGKDYLNHRYTDKRNILAVHIAKQLSQKKHRSKVGAVHLTNVFGDVRKVGLILTPPILENNDDVDESSSLKQKKRKRDDDDDGNKEQEVEGKKKSSSKGKKKKNKLRFRIRLIFGIKPDQKLLSSIMSHHQQHVNQHDDDSDVYSNSDDDEEGSSTSLWSSWIPRSRLLPNRSNNRSNYNINKKDDVNTTLIIPTPHYTNSLAEDLHLVLTTNLISSTLSTLIPSSNSTNITPNSSFHETLLLLKVWALQRGYLRGHDTFTTTTLAVILVYLYRTKVIGKRMGSVQAFVCFMKFWCENDWLGEDTSSFGSGSSSGSAGGGGGSSSLDAAAALKERKVKKKAAYVIPANGRSEAQTIVHCKQARLYLEDIRGEDSSSSSTTRPKTLLECYKACYTSSSSSCTQSSSSSSSIVNNSSHHDSPILLDPTMTINYLARLSPSFVRESRAQARAALRYIHGQEVEGIERVGAFKKLFLETNRFWTRYDAYFRLPLSVVMASAKATTEGGGGGKRKKKHGKSSGGNGEEAATPKVWGDDINDLGYNESVCRSVVEVLRRALGDRATAIRAFTCGNGDIRGRAAAASNGNDEYEDDRATKVIVDSDQFYAVPIRGNTCHTFGYAAESGERGCLVSPVPPLDDAETEPSLVVGLCIETNASRRIVDRGPPAEDVQGSQAFTKLWGEQFAQLRRFQDGAIVRAVVWNNPQQLAAAASGDEDVQFSGMDRSMGGIVEKIVQHIIKLHFTDIKIAKKRQDSSLVSFELRNMLSFIDGVSPSSTSQPSPFSDSLSLHKNVMTAFDSLADFLRQNTKTTFDSVGGKGRKVSNLGLPLSIDEVEPLDSCLRYSTLFPPVPHPLLGGPSNLLGSDKRKISGANVGSPILIQIRFEGSSKWPSSLNAMGAAKCAMLVQLAEGIKKMKQEQGRGFDGVSSGDLAAFDGPMDVTPNYLDLGWHGYSWRIIVRADQELRMLRSLRNPTLEARHLQLSLINRHVRGAMHHSLIHAVHTRHSSASAVVRLAHRWVASHMLSDMIPHEAIELMVAKIYTESTAERSNSKVGTPPSTVVAGFLSFLHLLSTHDWAREPMIVDPQNHISPHDRGLIHDQFTAIRGPELNKGPAMYIISPADYDRVEEMAGSKVVGEIGSTQPQTPANVDEKIWSPTITAKLPEKVVLSRASALAKCSHEHLISCIMRGNIENGWVAAFQESSESLTSYSALLRVDQSFITDSGCSSTSADCTIGEEESGPFERSMNARYAGPKELRKKNFKNLVLERDTLHEWQPVKSLVTALRSRYSEYAVFFYNEFAPDVIAMIWRPDAFKPQPFSAVVSGFKRPVSEFWKGDSLVITNTDDLMAEILYFARNIVSTFKVFDNKKP